MTSPERLKAELDTALARVAELEATLAEYERDGMLIYGRKMKLLRDRGDVAEAKVAALIRTLQPPTSEGASPAGTLVDAIEAKLLSGARPETRDLTACLARIRELEERQSTNIRQIADLSMQLGEAKAREAVEQK